MSRAGSRPAGRLHRRRGHHLHQVVDDHVADRAHGVVEMTAILDAEGFGHRDLHAGDVVAVPQRFEHRVREPQEQHLDQAHLAQEVIDPVELRLVDVLMDLLVQGLGRLEVVSERLFDHDPRVLGKPGIGEALDHAPEQKGRDLEVEHGLGDLADRGRHLLEGRRVREVPRDVGEAGGEAIEDGLVDRRAAALDRFAGALLEVVDGPVVDSDADDRAIEQPALLEPVERVEGHHLGEVTGDPEDHEHVGGPGAVGGDASGHLGPPLVAPARRDSRMAQVSVAHPVRSAPRAASPLPGELRQSSATAIRPASRRLPQGGVVALVLVGVGRREAGDRLVELGARAQV